MKASTMNNLGLYLIIVGVMSTIFGSYVIYASLGRYASCALAPLQCQMTPTVYVQFLLDQSFGNSASFYGILIVLIGAVIYISAQSQFRTMITKQEVTPVIPQTN